MLFHHKSDTIYQLRKKICYKIYDVQIQNYREGDFIRVVGDGVERDINEDGEFIEDRYEKYAEYDCTSAEIYEKLTGIHLDIPTGGYYLIQPTNSAETTWFAFDDMTKLYLASEDTYLPMKYLGNTEYDSLVLTPNNGLSMGSRFVEMCIRDSIPCDDYAGHHRR